MKSILFGLVPAIITSLMLGAMIHAGDPARGIITSVIALILCFVVVVDG